MRIGELLRMLRKDRASLSPLSCITKLRMWCSRLTGIDPVPVAPPAVGVRAEVRAKKTRHPEPVESAGIPDGGGFYCILEMETV